MGFLGNPNVVGKRRSKVGIRFRFNINYLSNVYANWAKISFTIVVGAIEGVA